MSHVDDPRYARMAYRPLRHDTMPAAWEAGEAVRQAHEQLRGINAEQQRTRRTARDIRTGKRLLWAVLGIALLVLGNGLYGTWSSAVQQAPARVVHVVHACATVISRC